MPADAQGDRGDSAVSLAVPASVSLVARVVATVFLVAQGAAAQEATSSPPLRRLSISPAIAWHNDGSPNGLDAGALLSARVGVPIGDRVAL
jgi:hypothetical protein